MVKVCILIFIRSKMQQPIQNEKKTKKEKNPDPKFQVVSIPVR